METVVVIPFESRAYFIHVYIKKNYRNILISFSCIRECGIRDSKVFVMLLSIMNIFLRGNTTF